MPLIKVITEYNTPKGKFCDPPEDGCTYMDDDYCDLFQEILDTQDDGESIYSIKCQQCLDSEVKKEVKETKEEEVTNRRIKLRE